MPKFKPEVRSSIIVVVIAVAAASVLFYTKKDLFLGQNTYTETEDQKVVATDETSRLEAFLLNKTQISVPEITSSARSSLSQLPGPLSDLLKGETENLVIDELTFTNGKTGYRARFNLQFPLFNSYSSFLSYLRGSNEWLVKQGLRTELASLIEAESDSYLLRIKQAEVSPNENHVVIEFVQN